jgi:ADP-ribose pyrophosphatase YjhB (NUDIX family)
MSNAEVEPEWLTWSRRLQSIAQNGLAFARDEYDIERYRAVRDVAAEMLSRLGGLPPEAVATQLAAESGYGTPKLDVRAFVLGEDGVLLVRERSDGRWTLPGGWIDVGESPREAAARETAEESGYLVRPVRLLALYDRRKHPHPPMISHVYKVFVDCAVEGRGERLENETDAVDFFRLDRLPPLSTERVTASQLVRLAQIHDHPDWPADLD